MTRKVEIFAAYGSDVAGALRNWEQIDPLGYGAFAASAVERQYRADHGRWVRTQTVKLERSAAKPKTDRLFAPPPSKADQIEVRSTIVHDGTEHTMLGLAGKAGAKVLREAALRDLAPAETTADRCRFNIELADKIEAASVAAGRPVSVGEVLGLVAA